MTLATGSLLSVNLGGIREFEYGGRSAKSAIWKYPVTGRVEARGVNLAGDDQAGRAAHGGPDKATYAYAVEDYRWWESEMGRRLDYGQFGENLTTQGIDVTNALVGERWEVGSMLLEVSEPRIPCWRLGVRMEDKLFPRRFTKVSRPGTYLRIIVEGDVVGRRSDPRYRSSRSRPHDRRRFPHLHPGPARGVETSRRSASIGKLANVGGEAPRERTTR